MELLIGYIKQFGSMAGAGIAVGGSMGGIVILVDYVITSVLSMMKGR